MVLSICVLLLLSLFLYLHFRFNFWSRKQQGLPILQYNQLSERSFEAETVTFTEFERQLQFLASNGYTSIKLQLLIDGGALPPKPVLITLDRAQSLEINKICDLLAKYSFCAVLFIPIGYIGEKLDWDDRPAIFMDIEQIKRIDQTRMEIAYNSYFYISYNNLTADETREDIESCVKFEEYNQIGLLPVLAFPDRKQSENKLNKKYLKRIFQELGIKLCLVKGGAINSLPFEDDYFLTRILIEGKDSLLDFKIKLQKGRCKIW